MTKGKAHGQNLAYQTLCKDIIRQLQKHEALTPYEGECIESGSHDDLMRMDGQYAHLFRLQARGYDTAMPISL